MAKILMCEFSNAHAIKRGAMDSHFEGFARELRLLGNDVVLLLTNNIVINFQSTDMKYRFLMENKVRDVVLDFGPNLIISYNNSIAECVVKNTFCPIIVYPADVVNSWSGLHLIKDNIDRYYFLETTAKITEQLKEKISDIPQGHIIPFGHVTFINAKQCEKEIEISFVGSLANYSKNIVRVFGELLKNYTYLDANVLKEKLLRAYNECNIYDIEQELANCSNSINTEKLQYEMEMLRFCNKRMRILSELTDIGVEIYGWPVSWSQLLMYNIGIFEMFNYQPIATLDDLEELYNKSVVSLNLPQGSATDGISWRVPDILASNAALLTMKKKDLEDLFCGYNIDFPYYESPIEARELALKLIQDNLWREELVEVSHIMIEDKCRLSSRVDLLSSTIGVQLDNEQQQGSLTLLNRDILFPELLKIEQIYNDIKEKILFISR